MASSSVPDDFSQLNSPASVTKLANTKATSIAEHTLSAVIKEANTCLKNPVVSSKQKSNSKLVIASNLQALSHHEPAIIPAISNPTLFRDSTQTKPTYWLVIEFNPPDPSIQNIADFRFSKNDIPWFLNATQKSNARLSRWKDGNTLYASRRTYH